MFLEPELNELERPNRGAIGLLSGDGDGDTADAGFAAPPVGDASKSDELEWHGALGLRSDAKRRADDEDDEELDDEVDDEDELDEDEEEFDDDTDDDFDDDELDEEDDDELEEFDDDDDDV